MYYAVLKGLRHHVVFRVLLTVLSMFYRPDALGNKENQEDTPAPLSTPVSPATGLPPPGLPHLTPFEVGQVYNSSAASQVHVMPTSNLTHVDVIVTPV